MDNLYVGARQKSTMSALSGRIDEYAQGGSSTPANTGGIADLLWLPLGYPYKDVFAAIELVPVDIYKKNYGNALMI